MRSKRKLLLLPAAALTALIVTVTGYAHADEKSAYNETRTKLVAKPSDGMATAVVKRRIYVAAGTYVWSARMMNHCDRRTALGAGWYTWTDTLDPKAGYYRYTSSLDPDNAGWATSTQVCAWWPGESGTWAWGSFLDPQF